MARKKNKYPIIEALEIIDIAAEGKAIGKYNDMIVFVPQTLPGDVVDVQISNKRRRFMEGYVVNYIKHSPIKIDSFCEHFGSCGGCKWQNLPYQEQLNFKEKQVKDQLSRIGKVDVSQTLPIIGSAQTDHYRNKLEFTFSNKRWRTRQEIESGVEGGADRALGFHISGMFDKILDITKCHLQASPSNEIRNALKEFTSEREFEYYDARSHQGFMRNVVIRTSSIGEVMVIVLFNYEDKENREAVLDMLKEKFPQITSLVYIINTKFNDSYSDLDTVCYHGTNYIFEEMEGLRFKIGPKSFYQTNSQQAYELYKVTRDFATLTGEEIVYDLYTGTGTIANFIAHSAKLVVGVEYIPEAIEDAKENSQINGITNTKFYAGDMKDVLNDAFIAENGIPDVIILDPPRAGIHDDVAQTILRTAPKRIVYVSCNPATQARDLSILDINYKVIKIQPVDMFPHTHHVENVVLLERKD